MDNRHSANTVRLPTVNSLSGDDCRLLVDSIVDYAIFMLDADGRVATWNTGAEKIKGYQASEIVGKHVSHFYTETDIAAAIPQQRLEEARRVGRAEDEGWRLRKDGTRFWASAVITALRNDRGEVTGFGKVTRDLTDHRRAEEELRRSEERFRLLVENIGDYAIYMLDPNGCVATWNLGAERMKGFSADEIIGRRFHVFFPLEDQEAGKPERELDMARTHGRFEDEGWRVRRDGTRFWANAILTALHDHDGALVGFAKITRDLTRRREAQELERRLMREEAARTAAEQAEQRLRESEDRYRALSQRLEIVIEGVADAITVQDSSGKVIFANTAAAHVCGFDRSDGLLSPPPDAPATTCEVYDEAGERLNFEQLPARRVLDGAPSSQALLCVRDHSTRTVHWYTVRATAARATDGSPLAVTIWHEITHEHRQELHAKYLATATAALGGSLEANQLLASLAAALVPALADWCVIHLLSGAELDAVAVAHVDPEKAVLAKEYQQRFPPHPDDDHGVWNVFRSGASELHREIRDSQLTLAMQDPERLAMLQVVGMRGAMLVPIRSRNEIIGVMSLVAAESHRGYDEADLSLAEELGRRAGTAIEHARLYASAQEAAKTADEASRAKDEFLAIVSHELRTPLNAIVGWSALLQHRTTDPTMTKALSVIYRNAEAQVKIIDDILDVSRVITGKFRLEPKPMNLVTVVLEAIDAVRASAEAKRLSLEFTPETTSCLIVADPVRMQQVIWNLLSNAVKFTERSGAISVATRQTGSNVSITVEDTGRGIDPEFLPFVFDRFRQADASITRRVGGLGLGLALVRHIVELHGGCVAAESEGLERGARFTITLPIRAVAVDDPRPPTPHARGERPSAANDLTGVRVLVVDDESDARELLEAVLGEAGAIVESASSASEGLINLQRLRPDVLVSDIGMPDEDGFTFIRRVRSLPANDGGRIPAIALTALARDEDRTAALRAGYTTHIGKPVDAHALTAVIANLATVNRPV